MTIIVARTRFGERRCRLLLLLSNCRGNDLLGVRFHVVARRARRGVTTRGKAQRKLARAVPHGTDVAR